MQKSKFTQFVTACGVAAAFVVTPVAAAPVLAEIGVGSGVSAEAATSGWVKQPRWTFKRVSSGWCPQPIHQQRGLYRHWTGIEYEAWTGPEVNMGGPCLWFA